MTVGARCVGWMILQVADLLRFSSTNISRGLQRMVPKNKRPENMQRAAVIWKKCLLTVIPVVRGQWPDCFVQLLK